MLEFIRENYVSNEKGQPKVKFKQSEAGKMLTSLLSRIEMTGRDYDIDFDYDEIPGAQKVNPRTGKIVKYKPIKISERKDHEERLKQRLLESRPDIIIPTGNMGCKNLLGIASITKTRGVPTKVKIAEDYEPWVLPMFSMEYYLTNPNIENLLTADVGTLGEYMKRGDEAFIPKEVDYELVTSIDRVREIFSYLRTNKPVSSWDLETNSLVPEALGAKPLIFSCSWEEAQGVTIPIEKREATWSKEELEEIYSLIKEYVADPEQTKVGHNLKYDIRFLMSTKGFQDFNSNMDTLIGYYLVVSQDVEDSKKLSDLAYELTDMGGYDEPLEEFKKEYTKKYVEQEKAKIDEQKEEKKKEIEEKYKEDLKEYKEQLKKAKEEGTNKPEKPVKEKMPKFPTKSSIKLNNEVDGGNFNYDWIPLELIHPYASGDTDCCLRVYHELKKRIQDNEKMYQQWRDFYPRLIKTLAHIESEGMEIDKDYSNVLIEQYTKEAERILGKIRELPETKQLEEEHMKLYQAGVKEWEKPPKERDEGMAKLRDKYNPEKDKIAFNPGSSVHKGKLLFKIKGFTLPYDKEHIKATPFGDGVQENELTWEDYKTDKKALAYILENYPEDSKLAELLTEYSKVNTLKNNFAVKLPRIASNKDGRVHGRYIPTGTSTSRLASKDPNAQQLPSHIGDPNRFDYHYPVKRMFTSRFSRGAILGADFSALEMRVLGLIARDEGMTNAFLNNEDLHTSTATIVFNKDAESITGDERQASKSVSFGLVYGESEASLAPKLGITKEEAEEIFRKYFKNKPNVKEFIDKTHDFVKKHGYVDTLQGHRRLIREAQSRDFSIINEGLRASVNTIIQGTGAYLTNLSLTYIDDYIREHNKRSRIIVTVHDSIELDVPEDEVEEMARVMKFVMENLPAPFLFIEWNGETIRYPIVTDVEIGTNYNDAVGYDPDDFKTFQSVKGYVKYYLDQEKIQDYLNYEKIPEDKAEEALQKIQEAKPAYQKIR